MEEVHAVSFLTKQQRNRYGRFAGVQPYFWTEGDVHLHGAFAIEHWIDRSC